MAKPSDGTLKLRKMRRYVFRMTDVHGKPYPLPPEIAALAPDSEFEFPLAPQSVAYPDRARTSLHPYADGTQGADEQGAGIPDVQISGTFGEGVRSNSAGVTLDGRQWQRALEMYISFYFQTQLEAARLRKPPALLEWHDVFRGAHLIVTPQGTPRGREDAGTPYRESYQLTLSGLRKTKDDLKARDAGQAQALTNACPFAEQCKKDGIAREEGCPFARRGTA